MSERGNGSPADGGLLSTTNDLLTTVDIEAPARRLSGATHVVVRCLAIGLSLFSLYWVLTTIDTHLYRISFLLCALVLTFLRYPGSREVVEQRVRMIDWTLVGLTLVALGWPLTDLSHFIYRAASPTKADLICGAIAILLVLEATRRTVGWILPVCAAVFLAYAYVGPMLDVVGLGVLAHRGYDLSRVIGTVYLTLDGMFGVPLDVAATYIILFTLYGAVLQQSGAGTFFLDWAMAAMRGSRSGASPGRATTLASVLLGTVSGSGVATTVTLGSVAWPLLKRAGYPAEVAGAVLSAGGIGAIMMPPALGAAAFLIAEFLKISYFQVIAMAVIPALLYYLSVLLMIEADSRRLGVKASATDDRSFWTLTRTRGYHFASLIVMVALLGMGFTAFRAVFWAMVLAIVSSFVQRDTAMTPTRLLRAMEDGTLGMLPVAATTATAGIIVGVVALTGLGLKMAGLIVAFAGGQLVLTVIYAAAAVLLVGLAVPVTASYIIAAVMIAPALTQVGIAPVAAHMFVFYYAVLSEVSPPTALSPFAAAAITGGDPLRTMLITWKYTLPAFLVPFVFTLSSEGMGLLLQAPLVDVIVSTVTAALGVAAFAMGAGGWLRTRLTTVERASGVAAGLLLLYPDPRADVGGITLLAAVVLTHMRRSARLSHS